jgi:putative redox protein
MKTTVRWKESMEFEGLAESHSVMMDAKAPIGKNSAATPKELVALGLGGCTAMDVIALLKKNKQLPESFEIEMDIESSTSGHPVVFKKAVLKFIVKGSIDAEYLIKAVNLSQTQFCGVSAMLSQALPIEYKIVLNGEEIKTGAANFETFKKEEL